MLITQGMTDKGIAAEIGDRLKQYRLVRNWTQKEIAAFAGVSIKAVRNAEKGTGTLLNYIKVLRPLDLVTALDKVIPEASTISPIQTAKMSGKTRKRAVSNKDKVLGAIRRRNLFLDEVS